LITLSERISLLVYAFDTDTVRTFETKEELAAIEAPFIQAPYQTDACHHYCTLLLVSFLLHVAYNGKQLLAADRECRHGLAEHSASLTPCTKFHLGFDKAKAAAGLVPLGTAVVLHLWCNPPAQVIACAARYM
jgi:hypothetical protein